jgi:hypothetical protein
MHERFLMTQCIFHDDDDDSDGNKDDGDVDGSDGDDDYDDDDGSQIRGSKYIARH